MRTLRQIIATFVLLAWFGAGVHMAVAHGGLLLGWHVSEVMHAEESSPEDDEHHHHDFDALTAAQSAKPAGLQSPAPQWLVLDWFLADLAALERTARYEYERPGAGDSPPDERAFGWLLDIRTALPVRGPNLAA